MNAPDDDPRTSDELFESLLAFPDHYDDHDAWALIRLLQVRAGREVLERALALLRHSTPSKRVLAANLLAQLGSPQRAFPEESLAGLRALLANEDQPAVLASAATAFSHNADARAVPRLLALRSHSWPTVRLSVARALGSQDKTPDVVTGLIELCRDPAPDVRDWATFALGSLSEVDTPRVREVLLERLEDSDSETRAEALVALAERKEERVLPYVIVALQDEPVGTLAVEAAWRLGLAGLASSELRSALIELTSWWDVDTELLSSAVAASLPEGPDGAVMSD